MFAENHQRHADGARRQDLEGDLFAIVNTLAQRGIQLRPLTEAIDTTTVGGELVFHVFAAVAQMERRLISARTCASLAAARARSRGGRPTVTGVDLHVSACQWSVITRPASRPPRRVTTSATR